jgi:hypothetical protein
MKELDKTQVGALLREFKLAGDDWADSFDIDLVMCAEQLTPRTGTPR